MSSVFGNLAIRPSYVLDKQVYSGLIDGALISDPSYDYGTSLIALSDWVGASDFSDMAIGSTKRITIMIKKAGGFSSAQSAYQYAVVGIVVFTDDPLNEDCYALGFCRKQRYGTVDHSVKPMIFYTENPDLNYFCNDGFAFREGSYAAVGTMTSTLNVYVDIYRESSSSFRFYFSYYDTVSNGAITNNIYKSITINQGMTNPAAFKNKFHVFASYYDTTRREVTINMTEVLM